MRTVQAAAAAILTLSLPTLVPCQGLQSLDSAGISGDHAPNSPAPRNPEFDITFGNALLFASEAQRQGLAVDEADIEKRLETYRTMYPTTPIDTDKIKTILLAESYLERQGIRAGKENKAALTEELKNHGFQDEAELERARRAQQTAALLQNEDIRSSGRRLLGMEKLRLQLSRPPPIGPWTADELRIPGSPEVCVAWLETECYVTAEEFNAAAGLLEFSRRMPLDSARIEAVKKYAVMKNAAEGRDAGETDWDEDELLAAYKNGWEGIQWLKSAREFGLPESDQSALEAAYRKYYTRYFRAREAAAFTLIGSTDSAYIDSLHRVLSGIGAKADSRAGAHPAASHEPALPWIAYKEEDLPSALTAPTDTFRIGDFTAPIRTPYGYFIVRLSRLQPVKAKQFLEVQGMLTYLATRDNFFEMDSLLEVKTRQYYQGNLSEFKLPDTLELRAWLAPPPSGQPMGGKQPSPLPPDTLRYRSLPMSSLDLPGPLRLELQKAARREPRKTFFGPFPGPYGRWHFQVKRARMTEGTIPYVNARRAIHEKLSTLPRIGRDTVSADSTKDKVMLNLALARRRLRMREERQQERIAGEIEARLRTGALDTARIADAKARRQELRLARLRLQEELWEESQAAERSFLNRVRMDTERISNVQEHPDLNRAAP